MEGKQKLIKISKTPNETKKIAKEFARTLQPGNILCFSGELGAGKTTFLKGLISEIAGISEEEVCSPTFVYLHHYAHAFDIYHFDLYRLRSSTQFLQMGFCEYLHNNKALCCIEWPEKIPDLLPPTAIFITLRYLEEGMREIEVRQP